MEGQVAGRTLATILQKEEALREEIVMYLRLDNFSMSEEEELLVKKARRAVTKINLILKKKEKSGEVLVYVVNALVYNNPLRLDFSAQRPGEMVRVYIIPEAVPLTAELFDGESLTKSFEREITDGLSDFSDYLDENPL